jgi:hypothetical protein
VERDELNVVVKLCRVLEVTVDGLDLYIFFFEYFRERLAASGLYVHLCEPICGETFGHC